MKILIARSLHIVFFLILSGGMANAGTPNDINTARNCSYMKPSEREMIAEINLVRSDPAGYIQYLDYDYQLARLNLSHFGKGKKSFSISVLYERTAKGERQKKVDTVWSYEYEEQVHAIESLINDLKNMKPVQMLEPDKGIYEAARKHALDQDKHNWSLGHKGSDGSFPFDRIHMFSPQMVEGNENLAGHFPEPTIREVVIQLLIDAGIPEYGHRYNMLDPKWTNAGCYSGGLKDEMYQWIQEFGEKGK